MIVRCRFCGQKINSRDEICEHCGKTLVTKTTDDPSTSVVGRQTWEKKPIPASLIYLTIVVGILLLVLMFTHSANDLADPALPPQSDP